MNKDALKKLPSFETARLIIRPFKETDFNDFVKWHNYGDIIYYSEGLYNFKEENEEEFIKFFIKRVPRMFETKESGIWCIAEKNSGINIGLIEVCKYDSYADTAQIHYSLSKEERKKGYMTEAVKCMIDWAFNMVELNRIYTYVLEENVASAEVLKRCGFQLEGIMRQSNANRYTKNGEEIKNTKADSRFIDQKKYRNDCIYALLKEEYKKSLARQRDLQE